MYMYEVPIHKDVFVSKSEWRFFILNLHKKNLFETLSIKKKSLRAVTHERKFVTWMIIVMMIAIRL